jgi:hypothetical protein
MTAINKNINIMDRTICLLLLCTTVVACKKNSDNENKWTVPKVKTATYGTGSPNTYYYDKEGRIVKTEDATYKWEFTYEPLKVTRTGTDLASGGIFTELNELNPGGYVSKRGNITYTYTPEGYRKTEIITGNNGSTESYQYYYNVASRLLDSTVKLKGSNWMQTAIYTYYTDQEETAGNENFGWAFLGKSLPYPVKSVIYWAPKQGIPYREIWRTESYSYLYDAAGRIVKVNSTAISYGQSASLTSIYTYY